MSGKQDIRPVRVLPEDVANKIAAGEVVERPASVVKELVENALDAGATRIIVRLVAAGRRTIEVIDNGHGMSEQDALLAIERHATSKIRNAEDIDNIVTLGFRGEALPSIASVSRFELVTRRAKDQHATRIRIEGGVLRDVSQTSAPPGTRVTVNRLYFNTPVRAKFLKGITTELSQSIDIVQRHALSSPGVAFQFLHNEKLLFDIPQNTALLDRIALLWGLGFVNELVELEGRGAGLTFSGYIGAPSLSRSARTHQYLFFNGRPIVNRGLQYGFEDGYRGLLTVGRRPVGIIMVAASPRLVDVNIHPAKREIRFRDEHAARQALRDVVRNCLEQLTRISEAPRVASATAESESTPTTEASKDSLVPPISQPEHRRAVRLPESTPAPSHPIAQPALDPQPPVQTQFEGVPAGAHGEDVPAVEPQPFYASLGSVGEVPMQIFDTYLLIPEDDRLLIIDQHALHERLTYDNLLADLQNSDYQAQQLVVPVLIEVPPAYVKILQEHFDLFSKLGIEIEPFGGNTFQVTALCHLYKDSCIPEVVHRVLDTLAQGDLFNREEIVADLLRLTFEACHSSVRAGDRLSPEERRELLEG
ncbi:MAG: DNA mismatch repair endonuclease MutL, partial [Candidatus Hydrogenedentes bacterium]|nr:DNA mismatch repair endonuclease MutL [Candidatus Hydrogenedentota bacterium]